jgi:hypothetical protein
MQRSKTHPPGQKPLAVSAKDSASRLENLPSDDYNTPYEEVDQATCPLCGVA